ncbi:MAG: sulfite exporter TauE/SafE family protein [Verrucomicrobiae bacterium]|nr:sulfite exporter TauE/SafE family protein [Verrucomicrobiae bacterium]
MNGFPFPDGDSFWLMASVVAFVGVSRSGFGGAGGILAVPMMALFLPAREAAGLLLPIMIFSDVFVVWHYRHRVDWRQIRRLIPGTLAGILIGAATLQMTDNTTLRRILGALCLLFVLIQLLREGILKMEETLKPGPGMATILGALAGYTSTLAHAGGPVMAMYLLPQHLDPQVFIGTNITYFALGNLIKLPIYIHQGMVSLPSLYGSLWMAPFMLLGTGLGVWINDRVSKKWFVTTVYILLFFAGIRLLL